VVYDWLWLMVATTNSRFEFVLGFEWVAQTCFSRSAAFTLHAKRPGVRRRACEAADYLSKAVKPACSK